jgi:hypothetical protein
MVKGMPPEQLLNPGRHNRAGQANMRQVGKAAADAHSAVRDRFAPETVTLVDYRPAHLMSHAEAQAAGEAMHDRWQGRHEDGLCGPPPFDPSDAAWGDMARAAWEAVWGLRRGRSENGNTEETSRA